MERGGEGRRDEHHTGDILGVGNPSRGEPSGILLQWGNRKRLRCVKIQVKGSTGTNKSIVDQSKTTTVRVSRRVVRSDYKEKVDPNGLLQRSSSTIPTMRRNPLESAVAMGMRKSHHHQGGQINGDKDHRMMPVSSDEKKVADGGVTSSGGSDDVVWPKFVMSLSNREKEEDFMAFKGCNRLPQRPKKRAKCVQKTLNTVCPGSWLCDLTLERYEVREKKISKKKRPGGLKAMGSMDSDSD